MLNENEMAGTLQTGTLVGGQWMTTNVDVRTVLERHQERKQEGLQTENDPIPSLGLLTQTLISSSIIRWIYPARVRSSEYRDVAFIGDNFIEIRQLDSNGHFHDVARKSDFGQRIRNACVIGSTSLKESSGEDPVLSTYQYDENGNVPILDLVRPDLIPPQFIMLAMESGDLAFLFAHNTGTDVEFITSYHKVLHKSTTEPSGKHLKVDPSSRYVAVASSEIDFVIYHLRSAEEVSTQRSRGESCQYIASEHHLHVRGVIHKMEFLYPAADDPNHIILLLLVVRNESTAMYVYEWEAGQSLKEIRSNNIRGLLLPSSCRMPLLLIPLTIMSAILLVSSESIMECHNILEGPPTFQAVLQPEYAVSKSHIGTGVPLWAAWTRPLRHPGYSEGHDDIYMAREDGFIAFLEIFSDPTVLVQSTIAAGDFGSTIGTAFNNLELAPDGMDFLITGGESCDGGSYLVAARQWAQLVEPISNWAPMIDFVTTAKSHNPAFIQIQPTEISEEKALVLAEPDKLFACTGRGSHGAISELRYGYEARVMLDIEGINYPVSETWVMPLGMSNYQDLVSDIPSSLLFLLCVGDESMLLHLTADFREIEEVSQSSTWLDLKFRTVAALAYNEIVFQVTERTINVSAEPLIMNIGGIQTGTSRKEYPSNEIIVAASIFENELALIVVKDASGNLELSALRVRTNTSSIDSEVFRIRPEIEILGNSIPLSQYPNSITITRQSDGLAYGIVCAAESLFTYDSKFSDNSDVLSLLTVFKIQDVEGLLKVENPADYWPLNQMSHQISLHLILFWLTGTANAFVTAERGEVPDACVSIANLRDSQRGVAQNELLLAGYRSGALVMICYCMGLNGFPEKRRTSRHSMGSTPVIFRTDPNMPNMALVCCDSKIWRILYDSSSNADPSLHRVWFTALESPLPQQPSVNHVSLLPKGLLLYTGNQLLVTSLDPTAKPVPRKMPLFGSPHRLLYSHRLEKVIVGMSQEGRSTIRFLDPESGSLVGRNIDSSGQSVTFPYGLGISGEKVLCLVEWEWKSSNIKNDLVLVGTNYGSLLIYSTGLQSPANAPPVQQEEICCSPFLEEHYDEAISAIVTCAKSFFISVGKTVRWVTLDASGDKLLTHAEYKLSSRVVSLSIQGHWLNVLTAKHSLITLLLVDKRKYTKCADQHGQLAPQFADETERDGSDQILVSNSPDNMKDDFTLIMVGDLDCTVAGLCYSKKAQSLVSNHRVVFEAELPFSIIKFRFGNTRPAWDRISTSSAMKAPPSIGELLGIGVDGSLMKFSLLEDDVWQLLRFLQNLVHRSSGEPFLNHVPSHLGNIPDPRTKHVNGDVLKRFLSHKMLERLLMADEARTEHRLESRLIEEFCSLVKKLHRGKTDPPEQSADKPLESCLADTYRLLADLLRPAF